VALNPTSVGRGIDHPRTVGSEPNGNTLGR
jgi:hypothetical protein